MLFGTIYQGGAEVSIVVQHRQHSFNYLRTRIGIVAACPCVIDYSVFQDHIIERLRLNHQRACCSLFALCNQCSIRSLLVK